MIRALQNRKSDSRRKHMSIDSGFVILAFGVPCISWVMTILVKNVQHVIIMKWI